MERQKCVLYDRDCIGCMECETCDLDPSKVCNNCGKCLHFQDYATIAIDKIYMDPEEYEGKDDGFIFEKNSRKNK